MKSIRVDHHFNYFYEEFPCEFKSRIFHLSPIRDSDIIRDIKKFGYHTTYVNGMYYTLFGLSELLSGYADKKFCGDPRVVKSAHLLLKSIKRNNHIDKIFNDTE